MDSEECLAKLEKKREIIEELKDAKECAEHELYQQKAEMKQLLSLIARIGNRPFLWCLHCMKPTLEKQIRSCAQCFASLPCEEWCGYTYPRECHNDWHFRASGKKILQRCDICKDYLCNQCSKFDIKMCSGCFNKRV